MDRTRASATDVIHRSIIIFYSPRRGTATLQYFGPFLRTRGARAAMTRTRRLHTPAGESREPRRRPSTAATADRRRRGQRRRHRRRRGERAIFRLEYRPNRRGNLLTFNYCRSQNPEAAQTPD